MQGLRGWSGGGVSGHRGPDVQGRGAQELAAVDVDRSHAPRADGHPGGAYFMPLRSTWLAAMSMTLMMKAMAKAQIRLFRTHVWRICWLEQAGEPAEGCSQPPALHPRTRPRAALQGGHSLSTSTGHSSAVPRWLSSSVMMMFSMSFMDRCSQKVS